MGREDRMKEETSSLGLRHKCNLFLNEKKRSFYNYFSFFFLGPTEYLRLMNARQATVYNKGKVHQSDTREIISLVCPFFFSFFFFFRRVQKKNSKRGEARQEERKRRRVRIALMTKHSVITTIAAVAYTSSSIYLSTST